MSLVAMLATISVAVADLDRAGIYRAQSVTNGFGEENRAAALVPVFEDVMVKASGDPRLIGDPRVMEMARHAPDYVASFAYRDLLNNRPAHDSQGTEDRPQYLTAEFDPTKIDALLASLGRKPWPIPRPAVVAYFDVTPMKGAKFTLARDGGDQLATDMRAALAAAADRTGLPLMLLQQDDVDIIRVVKSRSRPLVGAIKSLGGDVLLVGTIDWPDEGRGWAGDWRLDVNGEEYRWEVRRVSFDDAFRNVVRGTAQILSGNGRPDAATTVK
jgi:hypothetical protein